MDNFEAFNRPNSYPGYTLSQLIAFVEAGQGSDAIRKEIAHRQSNDGSSNTIRSA